MHRSGFIQKYGTRHPLRYICIIHYTFMLILSKKYQNKNLNKVQSKESKGKPVRYQRFSSSMVEMNKLFKAETDLIDKIRELMIEMQPKLSQGSN